jgi:hypothetical protein
MVGQFDWVPQRRLVEAGARQAPVGLGEQRRTI